MFSYGRYAQQTFKCFFELPPDFSYHQFFWPLYRQMVRATSNKKEMVRLNQIDEFEQSSSQERLEARQCFKSSLKASCSNEIFIVETERGKCAKQVWQIVKKMEGRCFLKKVLGTLSDL